LVAGYGEVEFRPSLTVSEMVPSNSQVILRSRAKPAVKPKLKKIFEEHGKAVPGLVSVQIFGSDPVVMAESARINEELGADIIDINMGCPANKIVKNGSGADLMKNPPQAAAIISAVVRSVRIPVTVKIRTGWDANNKNAGEFARMAEDSGTSMIAVHGRTRAQLYSGEVDFAAIAEVKKAVKMPVIGNGNVVSPESAREMIERTGVDGVMIGRGACGAPWLLHHAIAYLKTGRLLPPPSVEERRRILLAHLAGMVDYYGERAGILIARKHAAWYSKGLRNSAEFRVRVNASNTLMEVEELIMKMFV
jgi:tRNA-dihydrouridine synthase B